VRADLLDIVEIFEVNRKECARLLVEYPRWAVPGTFKPRPGDPAEAPDRIPFPGRDWQLESTLIEVLFPFFNAYAMLTGTWANQTILGSQFLLPEGPVKPIYYMALITELCKLSPQTVGPAVGKSIRKIYGYCANGLDVEVLRRFSEWFSVHMSNFGFQWVWKEWSVPSTQSASRVLKRRQGSRSGIADATSKTSLCAASAGTRDSVVIL
jgi:nuclear cap-binding protein subunit 1